MGSIVFRIFLIGAACLAAGACSQDRTRVSWPPSDSYLVAQFDDHRIEFELLRQQAIVDMKRCKAKSHKTDEYEILALAEDALQKAKDALQIVTDAGGAIEAAEKAVEDATANRDGATEQFKKACNLFFDTREYDGRTPARFLGPTQIEAYVHLTRGAGLNETRIDASKQGVWITAFRRKSLSGNLRKGFYYTERDIAGAQLSCDIARASRQHAQPPTCHRLIESARKPKSKKPGEFTYKNWYIFLSRE